MMDAPSRLLSAAFFAGPLALRLDRHRLAAPYPLHWHEFYEWSIVLAGTGWHTVNGERHALAPGEAFLLTPADFHAIEPEPGQSLELANLIFTRAMLGDALAQLLFDAGRARQVRCVAGEGADAVHACLVRIAREQAQSLQGGALLAQAALAELLVLWHRFRPAMPATAGSRAAGDVPGMPPGIRKALLYLQHHFRQPVTLEEVADQAHLSSNYFSDLFHRSVGCTFGQYLQRLRLEFAHALLQAGDLPVTQVAYSAGFNTLTHFSRVFRQAYGHAPSQAGRRGRRAGRARD